MVDGVGRLLLREMTGPGTLWIAEGATDYLTCATAWGDAAEDAPAVIGILSGSWTPSIAARIPSGTRVVIAVDHDQAGEKYAARIAASLAGRCTLERWMPEVTS